MIHFASNPNALKQVAACNTRIRPGMTTSTKWEDVTCVECLHVRLVPPTTDASTTTASGPLDLRAFALIARSEQRRIEEDRERLIANMEWLVRDLTREIEALKADPNRTPSTSILTGSLPHDIQAAATRILAGSRMLHEFVHEFQSQHVTLGVTTVRP